MKNKIGIFLLSIACFLIILECFTRCFLGLGEVPVYMENNNYEYIYGPNQRVSRFGNLIITNEHSMRSLPLSKKDEIRILKFGDSVINGGSLTGHDSLASSILEKKLSQEFNKKIRVLNVSAGSWGPENAFRYLHEKGDFGSNIFVLVFSSHDLYDNMEFKKIVGVHPSYPSEQPCIGITDAIFHYLLPEIEKVVGVKKEFTSMNQISEINHGENLGWKHFMDYSRINNKKILVYLHFTKKELKSSGLNPNFQRIIQFLEENNVKYILGRDYITSFDGYRDNIHINSKGQKKLAEVLYPFLSELVISELN